VRPLGKGREIAPGVRVLGHIHRSRALDVYDAWCERRACRVAVKTPRPDRLRSSRTVAALLREGRLLRRLAHPHVVRGYEVNREPRPTVVLETLGGETLAHLFSRAKLPAGDVAQLGLQLTSALRYLHGEGVLHLDLKPSNVVVEAGRARLLDLSVARRPGRARPGIGTWCNMAPEQARGGELGPSADVWGLGTVLWEAAAGRNPFEGWEELEHPQLVHRAPAVGPRARRLPAELAEAIDACLEPQPEARPTVEDLAVVLEMSESS
jgi:serine/threonine protein kinase